MNVLFFFGGISGKTQEEGLMRVEELKAELTTLKEVTREDKKSQTELTQQVSDLSEELTKEKVSFFFSHMVCCFLEYYFFKPPTHVGDSDAEVKCQGLRE